MCADVTMAGKQQMVSAAVARCRSSCNRIKNIAPFLPSFRDA
jgi:hypothetical protein